MPMPAAAGLRHRIARKSGRNDPRNVPGMFHRFMREEARQHASRQRGPLTGQARREANKRARDVNPNRGSGFVERKRMPRISWESFKRPLYEKIAQIHDPREREKAFAHIRQLMQHIAQLDYEATRRDHRVGYPTNTEKLFALVFNKSPNIGVAIEALNTYREEFAQRLQQR